MTSGLRAPLVAWVAATSLASLTVLVLVLELGGGAPGAPPESLPDAGRVPDWVIAVLPLARWAAAIVMVGLAMVGCGVLDRPHRGALEGCAAAAIVLSALALLQVGAIAWRVQGQVPLLDDVQARGLLAQAALAAATALLARAASSVRLGAVVFAAAIVTLVPAVLTGHVRTATRPTLTAVALVAHVVAATVWVGGLLALCWFALRDEQQWPAALRRFSPVALAGVLTLAVSGSITMLGHITIGELLTSAYGAVIVLKAVLLGGLAAFGRMQRRYILARGGRPRRSFVLVAASELTAMAIALALATGLAQTPPPS